MEQPPKNQISETLSDDLADRGSPGISGAFILPDLVLASTSPRRAEILRIVGWPFETCAVDVDESRRSGENATSYVQRLAREKAKVPTMHFPSRLVLGADTVVVIENEILVKPWDKADARRMLRRLSGQWHQVLTGVALRRGESDGHSVVALESTEVKFAEMSDGEIEWYVSTGEPLDKAGAYAIQGRGARFIEEIKGDYFNVVGLPIRLVYELAQQF